MLVPIHNPCRRPDSVDNSAHTYIGGTADAYVRGTGPKDTKGIDLEHIGAHSHVLVQRLQDARADAINRKQVHNSGEAPFASAPLSHYGLCNRIVHARQTGHDLGRGRVYVHQSFRGRFTLNSDQIRYLAYRVFLEGLTAGTSRRCLRPGIRPLWILPIVPILGLPLLVPHILRPPISGPSFHAPALGPIGTSGLTGLILGLRPTGSLTALLGLLDEFDVIQIQYRGELVLLAMRDYRLRLLRRYIVNRIGDGLGACTADVDTVLSVRRKFP